MIDAHYATGGDPTLVYRGLIGKGGYGEVHRVSPPFQIINLIALVDFQ
jgi:hypothetical protein